MSDNGGGTTGSVTLVIDADTARYIANIARAAKANQELGEHGKHALEKITGEAIKSLVKMVSLKEVAEGLAKALNESAHHAEKVSRSVGAETIGLATSLGGLGIKRIGAVSGLIENTVGGTTLEQRGAFVNRLATTAGARDQFNRPAMPLSEEDVRAASVAYARGGDVLFGQGGDDLIKALTDKRRGGNANERLRALLKDRFGVEGKGDVVGEALETLDPEVREEMDTIAFETQQQAKVRAAERGDEGRRARRAGAIAEARQAGLNFGQKLFVNTVGALPVAGEIVEAGNRYLAGQDDETYPDGQRPTAPTAAQLFSLKTDWMQKTMQDIADTNRQMAQGTPHISAGGERAP